MTKTYDEAMAEYEKQRPIDLEIDRLAGIMSDAVHDRPWEEFKRVSPITADIEIRRARAIVNATNNRLMGKDYGNV